MRKVPTYRKDIGPRLGFAYGLDSKTVVRGGAGIYFGMSPATNFQYPGTAFRKTANIFFTHDNFANCNLRPWRIHSPADSTGPQGTQYGQLANWGYQNNNDLGTTAARDADIYQWNVGIQRELPSQIVLGVDYVGQPQHAFAMGWHKQPRLHLVVFAGASSPAARPTTTAQRFRSLHRR